MIADQTGTSAPNGLAGLAGIQAAIQTINDAGGVAGHQIDMGSPIDSQSTVQGGQAAIRQALDASPVAVTGSIVSTVLAAQEPALKRASVAYVVDSVTSNAVKQPWYFGIQLGVDENVKLVVAGVTNAVGGSISGKRVAVEGLNSTVGAEIVTALKQDLVKRGAEIVATELTASASVGTFTSQAQNIVSSKPDIVVEFDSPNNTILVAKALATAGYQGPIVGSVAANSLDVFKGINSSKFIAPFAFHDPSSSQLLTEAAKKYGFTKYQNSPYFSAGYAMGYTLKAGLEKCGFPCSSEKLESTLRSQGEISVPAGLAFGPIKFEPGNGVGLTAGQFYGWDSAKQATSMIGPVVQL
ncbi:ABC transporter substrate-binding protein [Streptomyces sp. NPDC001982]|uniref:ABC transporter substrate-binding protein n=1 Tax=Streptomyces sp. NPDC001982 TaxID=3154405 RepID=UPI0033330ED9